MVNSMNQLGTGFTTGISGAIDKYPGLDENTKKLVESGKKTYKDALTDKLNKEKEDKAEAAANAVLLHAKQTGNKNLEIKYDFAQTKKNIIKLRREQAKSQGIDDSKWTDEQVYNGLVKKLGNVGMDKLLNGDMSFFDGGKKNTSSDIKLKSPETGPGTIAALGGAALGASYLIPKTIEKVGTSLYNAALKAGGNPEAFAKEGDAIATYKAGLGPKPKKIVETALEQPGVWGTPTGISAAVKKNMKTIWDKTIQPVMDNITKGGWKIGIGKLEKSVGETIDKIPQIKNVQGYADELKNAVSEFFGSRMDKGVSSWTIDQLQGEKVALRNFLQKKVQNGAILASDADQMVNKVVSDTFSDIIHNTLKSVGAAGQKASKAFIEWGNQKALEGTSKLYGKSPLKGGGMGIIQTAQESIGVPLATAGGKLLARVGKYTNIPEMTYDLIKGLGKDILKKVKGGKIMPAMLMEPDFLSLQYQRQGMSKEEADKKSLQASESMLQLPGESLKYILDKALGLPQTEESKKYWASQKIK